MPSQSSAGVLFIFNSVNLLVLTSPKYVLFFLSQICCEVDQDIPTNTCHHFFGNNDVSVKASH